MPTKIDIISGFLGAGKTTLINRILEDALKRDKVAIVENEFGKIGIDGHRFAKSGVAVREISGGCICCSLFGNFVSAARKLIAEFRPDRIIVEPTGVGKLTDVLKALEAVGKAEPIEVKIIITVVDPLRYGFYTKMFGDFFNDQIKTARTIFLSRTQLTSDESIENIVKDIKAKNQNADIVIRPWDQLSSAKIISIAEENKGFAFGSAFERFIEDARHHYTGEELTAWNRCTSVRYSKERFREIIRLFETESRYGDIIRGKGFFQTPEDSWIEYDYVSGEISFREADQMDTGKIIFIGKNLNPSGMEELLGSPAAKGEFK